MRFFNRSPPNPPKSDANADPEANAGHFEAYENDKHRKHLQYQIAMSSLFTTLYPWIKEHAVEIFLMASTGGILLLLNRLKPPAQRFFPVYTRYNSSAHEIVYPQFAYPRYRSGFIIPIWLGGVLPSIVPAFIFLLMQYRIRSFWDLNNAFIGLLYSLLTTSIFQVVFKLLIGGLRPHFLSVCNPDTKSLGHGFDGIMYDRSICTNKDEMQISFAMSSFPSGHTASAFAGFIYLSLYLNAKFKVWSNYHAGYWKLLLVLAPILGASLIGGSVFVDYNHNWYDILAGAVIGTIMAVIAYRAVWASVLDFRFNHVPLMRHMPYNYSIEHLGHPVFGVNTVTKKADWGTAEKDLGGAPFDAHTTSAVARGAVLDQNAGAAADEPVSPQGPVRRTTHDEARRSEQGHLNHSEGISR